MKLSDQTVSQSVLPLHGKSYLWTLFCPVILGLLYASALPAAWSRYTAAAAFLLLAGSALALPLEYALWALAIGILNGDFIGRLIFGVDIEWRISAAPVHLATVMALLAFVRLAWKWEPPPRHTNGLWWFICVFVAIDFWLLIRADNWESLRPTIGRELRILAFCLVCVRYGVSFGRESAHRFIGAIGLSLIAPALYFFLFAKYGYAHAGEIAMTINPQTAEFWQSRSTQADEIAMVRANSLVGDPNYLALIWSLGAALALSLVRTRGWVWRTVALGGFLVALAGIVMAGSRTGALAFCAGFAVWAYVRPRFGLMLLPGFAALAIWLFLAAPMGIQERLLSQGAFVESRAGAFQNAVEMFLQSPWFGMGQFYYEGPHSNLSAGAHNSILEAAAQGGVVYLSAYMAFLAYLLATAIKAFRRQNSLLTEAYLVVVAIYLVGSQGLHILATAGEGIYALVMGGAMLTVGTGAVDFPQYADYKARAARRRRAGRPQKMTLGWQP